MVDRFFSLSLYSTLEPSVGYNLKLQPSEYFSRLQLHLETIDNLSGSRYELEKRYWFFFVNF